MLARVARRKRRGLGDKTGGLKEEGLGGTGSPTRRAGTLGSEAFGPLGDIQFGDSFELDDAARQTLQQHARWLMRTARRVEIEGHCDDRGTIEYNLALGAKRALRQVPSRLARRSGDRVTTISYGVELPVCHEQSGLLAEQPPRPLRRDRELKGIGSCPVPSLLSRSPSCSPRLRDARRLREGAPRTAGDAPLADTQVAIDKTNRRLDTVQTGIDDRRNGGTAVKGLGGASRR